MDYLLATADEIVKDIELETKGEFNITDYNMAIEYLMENDQLDKTEQLIKIVSDSRMIGEIIYNNCTLEFFKKFIDYEFANHFNKTVYTNENALHDAILYANKDVADYLLKERGVTSLGKELPHLLNNMGYTSDEYLFSMKYILDNGLVDLNYFLADRKLYLLELCVKASIYMHSSEIVDYIIALGADLSVNGYAAVIAIIEHNGSEFNDTLANIIINLDKKSKESKEG